VLLNCLQNNGYESVELSDYGFYEKAELFATATDVIGLSGAGMMSVMFCAPGTQVVELFPSNFVGYQYASICGALNQNHYAYIFPNNSFKTKLTRYSGKFDIDVDDFMSFLERL
jgi:capsular polysaccharide biosynthesis protein